MRLFTIGFTKKSAEEFFTRLQKAGVRRVVDVRLNNTSQIAGFAKARDLEDFTIRDTKNPPSEKHAWKGVVSSGGRALELTITDPAFCERLNTGYKPSQSCLLTMSLSMPYKPPEWTQDEPPACWKLIAGIIEL